LLNYLEQTTGSSSLKRVGSDIDIESPPSKRSMVSSARFDEMKMENRRLKNKIEKYQNEWMRKSFF
jgi:hypothetical protein